MCMYYFLLCIVFACEVCTVMVNNNIIFDTVNYGPFRNVQTEVYSITYCYWTLARSEMIRITYVATLQVLSSSYHYLNIY